MVFMKMFVILLTQSVVQKMWSMFCLMLVDYKWHSSSTELGLGDGLIFHYCACLDCYCTFYINQCVSVIVLAIMVSEVTTFMGI